MDTYHAATAVAALEQGAVIINDISACAFDPELLDVLVQYKPGYVLMHSRGRPENMQRDPRYDDVRRDVQEFFERQLARLTAAGLPENRIVLDPGIGFGKTLNHNLAAVPSGGLAGFRQAGAHGPVHEIRVRRPAGAAAVSAGHGHSDCHGPALEPGRVLAPGPRCGRRPPKPGGGRRVFSRELPD